MQIALIGPAGVGKSTVGKGLAANMGVPFADLDEVIEQTSEQSIPAIFSSVGEAGFRKIELDALQTLTTTSRAQGLVLATGGGAVTQEACRRLLSTKWTTIFLDASLPTLVSHVRADTSVRPLFAGGPTTLEDKISDLYHRRLALYMTTATHRICVDDKTVGQVITDILQYIASQNSTGPSGGAST